MIVRRFWPNVDAVLAVFWQSWYCNWHFGSNIFNIVRYVFCLICSNTFSNIVLVIFYINSSSHPEIVLALNKEDKKGPKLYRLDWNHREYIPTHKGWIKPLISSMRDPCNLQGSLTCQGAMAAQGGQIMEKARQPTTVADHVMCWTMFVLFYALYCQRNCSDTKQIFCWYIDLAFQQSLRTKQRDTGSLVSANCSE